MGLFSSIGKIVGAVAPAVGGFFGGPVGSALGGIASAGLGYLSSREQTRAMAAAGQLDLGRLRAEAIENGFNPLTVLGATGGAGFNTGPALPGFLSLASGLVGGAMDGFAAAENRRNQGLVNNLVSAQADSLRAATNSNLAADARAVMDRAMPGFQPIRGADAGPAGASPRGVGAVVRPSMGEPGWTPENPIPTHYYYRTPDGRVTLGPNPDGADLDQIPAAEFIAGGSDHDDRSWGEWAGDVWDSLPIPALSISPPAAERARGLRGDYRRR